jgi:hypothetical protein
MTDTNVNQSKAFVQKIYKYGIALGAQLTLAFNYCNVFDFIQHTFDFDYVFDSNSYTSEGTEKIPFKKTGGMRYL